MESKNPSTIISMPITAIAPPVAIINFLSFSGDTPYENLSRIILGFPQITRYKPITTTTAAKIIIIRQSPLIFAHSFPYSIYKTQKVF